MRKSRGAVEQRKETVPIYGEQEGSIRRGQGSTRWKYIFAVSQPRDIERLNRVDMGKLGDEDQLFQARRFEGVEKVLLQQRLESALFRHPNGPGFEESPQRGGRRIVAQLLTDGADGGQQGLAQLGAGLDSCLGGNGGPGVFRAEAEDLLIAGIAAGRLPGKLIRDADKRMEDYVDGFEFAIVRLNKRRVIRRVGCAFELHPASIPKPARWLGASPIA